MTIEEVLLKQTIKAGVEVIAEATVDKIKTGVKNVIKRVRSDFRSTYMSYLNNTTEKIAYSRTFLARGQSNYIYDFYEPVAIKCGKLKPQSASIDCFKGKFRSSVIVGSAGSGKSTILKHLFLESIFKQEDIPILLELRSLNESQQTLESLI